MFSYLFSRLMYMFGRKNHEAINRFGNKNTSTAYSFGSKNDSHHKKEQYHEEQEEKKQKHNDLERISDNTQNHQMKNLNRSY